VIARERGAVPGPGRGDRGVERRGRGGGRHGVILPAEPAVARRPFTSRRPRASMRPATGEAHPAGPSGGSS
jgi:hypothetical protein